MARLGDVVDVHHVLPSPSISGLCDLLFVMNSRANSERYPCLGCHGCLSSQRLVGLASIGFKAVVAVY